MEKIPTGLLPPENAEGRRARKETGMDSAEKNGENPGDQRGSKEERVNPEGRPDPGGPKRKKKPHGGTCPFEGGDSKDG